MPTPQRVRDISSVLVANRGEIAVRVFRTCAAMGIDTVAVFSDPDADAVHTRAADTAVRLPGSSSAETYLRGDAIIAAATAAGADAIHPGYGFLSENAEFAQAVIDAGLVWIGPPPAAITAMGSKVNAKRLMAAAGVPVLGDLDPDTVTESDLPILVKASAGGGGRGMRIVRSLDDLPAQVAAAGREALSAFGDATVFCEPYVERGHHIEVQVMADCHGTVLAVGERECSIQRRHQKVVEEAPAPLVERLGGDLRERLYAAARSAVAAIGYQGAGTVEFLADESGRFYFLETNTRLQVEHPVTELTTRTDLVGWQLLVASGARLPDRVPRAEGHAIEVRLYAEDPAADWRPWSGPVREFAIDADTAFGPLDRPGIRVDGGVDAGDEISPFYDPMLAKVIAWAPERRRAAAMLARSLARARIHGPITNRDMLVATLRHPAFLAGDTDTGFIDTVGLDVLAAPRVTGTDLAIAATGAALADAAANRAGTSVVPGIPSGYRNLPSGHQTKTYRRAGATDESAEITVRYRHTRAGVDLPDLPDVTVVAAEPGTVVVETGGVRSTLSVTRYPDLTTVDGPSGSVALVRAPRFVDPSAVARPGSLIAPMPGSVIRLAVAEGDEVTAGQPVMWLEAMKMEHTITAPADGVVASLAVAVGQQLSVGDVLAVIEDRADQSAGSDPDGSDPDGSGPGRGDAARSDPGPKDETTVEKTA